MEAVSNSLLVLSMTAQLCGFIGLTTRTLLYAHSHWRMNTRVRAQHGTDSSGEHVSDCLGKHGSRSSASTALALLCDRTVCT